MDETEIRLLSMCFPEAGSPQQYVSLRNGVFTLSDSKTCDADRRSESCPESCNREILKIATTRPVSVVSFDEWLQNTKDSKVDYLIFDADGDKRRFAFCELTCSLEQYVNPYKKEKGKRAKAYSQMLNTWRLIADSDNPVFGAQVRNFVSKIGIFGWRDRNDRIPPSAMRSANSFLNTPGSKAGFKKFSNYTFGENFEFIQVRYPHELKWQ